MANDLGDQEADRAFAILAEQARIRLEMPMLLSKALDLDMDIVKRAIRDWGTKRRPLQDIAAELRRAVGEG